MKTPTRIRVLHLEDNATDADLIAEYLDADAVLVDIRRVWTRDDFFREVASQAFDVILADHKLPVFDGDAALAIAREQAPDIPFIFVSGTLGEDVAVEAMKQGATDYVVKQRLERLAGVITRALSEVEERQQRRRAEAALIESEEHYRFAAELNPQVSWTALPDGQLDRVAERWREWTGTSGLGDTWGQGLHIEDLARSIAAWSHSIATGEPYDIEHRIKMASGEFRWARSRAFPRRNDASEIVRWYGTTEDIQDQKLLEDALRDFTFELERKVDERTAALELAQEALRQSQKLEAMGQLTGGVAHDFNNLLTPIIGSLDMLQRRGVGGERERRLIDGAAQSAERARVLVQRLLAFARRQPLSPEAVDISALVAGMAELVSSTSGPHIKVIVDASSEAPPAVVDPNQLEMAILNLCVNARDAMPDGGTLTIATRVETIGQRHPSGAAAGMYVVLSVSDTGVGMDQVTVKRAIEPFFSTKGIGKGTGLGLSMVHGLASQLGGAMTINSRPSVGTSISLLLPVSDLPVITGDNSNSSPGNDTERGTVLLVDDESFVRASTADMLSDIGYRVVECANAEEALRVIEKGLRFDLLVTDHLMPGMSGVDLARSVRSRYPDVPILIISGYADAETIAPDLPRLSKPFRQADLSASIKAQIH